MPATPTSADGAAGGIRIDLSIISGYSLGSTDADAEVPDTSEPDAGYSDTPQ